jgi:hypothetical protein
MIYLFKLFKLKGQIAMYEYIDNQIEFTFIIINFIIRNKYEPT